MPDDRDLAAMLRALAHQLWVIGRPDLVGAADLGADAIGRLEAELSEARAAISRLHAEATPLRNALGRLVDAKAEKDAHGETPLYRELKAGAWERAREVLDEDFAPAPDCPSIVEAFAELSEIAGDSPGLDELLAAKEADRQGRHELAVVATTTDGLVLGWEDLKGFRAYVPRDLATVWTRAGYLAEARDWLARHAAPAPDAGPVGRELNVLDSGD